MNTRAQRTLALAARAAGLLLACATLARAQEPKPAPPPPRQSVIVPVRVQVVIARQRDGKPVSRVPYMLTINATDTFNLIDPARIRMGVEMRPSGALTSEGKPVAGVALGTNIDCRVQALADNRFRVDLTIDESSFYDDEEKTRTPTPAFKSFRFTDILLLRDGQTQQATSATDRFTGEVVSVDVTLTVIK